MPTRRWMLHLIILLPIVRYCGEQKPFICQPLEGCCTLSFLSLLLDTLGFCLLSKLLSHWYCKVIILYYFIITSIHPFLGLPLALTYPAHRAWGAGRFGIFILWQNSFIYSLYILNTGLFSLSVHSFESLPCDTSHFYKLPKLLLETPCGTGNREIVFQIPS